MARKSPLPALVQKIALAIAKDKPLPDPKVALRQLDACPDPLAEMLDGLEALGELGSHSAAAHFFLIESQLTELRYGIDRGYSETRAEVDAFLEDALARCRAGRLPDAFLPVLGTLLHEAGLPPSEAFMQAMADNAEASAVPVDNIGQLFEQLSEGMGGDPFDMALGLAETVHSFPPDLGASLPHILWQSPKFHDVVPLMALDASAQTRAVALHTLRSDPKHLSGDSLRRLITLRNWLPETERPALDQAVAAARRYGIACSSATPNRLMKVEASLMDGSGAMGFLLLIQDGKSYRIGSVLVRRGHGLLDAWCTPDALGKREAEATLNKAARQGQTHPVGQPFMDQVVRHHLARGLENRIVPPLGLLQVAEAIGAAAWLPERLDIPATLQRLEMDVAATEQKGNPGHGDMPDGLAGMLESWFEQGPEVDALLGRGRKRGKEPLEKRLVDEILEPRREKWLETMVWAALWCQEGPPALRRLMPEFLSTAKDLAQGRPLPEIPAMAEIAFRTLLFSRWVFLTKTAKGQFWRFLPEKLAYWWLSHNLSR